MEYDTDVLFVCEDLCACRVCLATDVRLEALYPGRLAETYEQLTGTTVSPTDGLPQHLCSMCAALLKKAAAFRNKCRDAQAYLQQGCNQLLPYGVALDKAKITMSLIRNLDKGPLKLPYITTNTLTLTVSGDIDENFEQTETAVKLETETDFEIKENKLDCEFNVPIEDLYESMLDEEPMEQDTKIKEEIFADINIIKTDLITVNKAVPRKRKHVKVSPAEPKDNAVEKTKEYLIKSKEETEDHYKQLFYNYVLDKYFYKTKESFTSNYDMFVSDAEDQDTVMKTSEGVEDLIDKSVVIVDRNVTENGTVTDNAEGNNQILYDYVKKKYVNKAGRQEAGDERKIVDVIRLKVRKIKTNKNFKSKEELADFAKTYNFDIIKLTKSEQILELQRARRSTLQFKKSRFSCVYCFRGFKTETVFNDHMAVHDPASGSHVCEVCQHRFPTPRRLKKHVQMHKTKFVCRECQQTVRSCTMAREHYKSHAGVRYECEHCGSTFRKYASRTNHIRIHHGATACDICYEGFQGASGLNQHKAKAHKQTYQCASCDVHFDNAHAMKRHIGSSPDGACDPNIRACAKCGERCGTGERLGEHVARLHARTRAKPQRRRYEENLRGNRRCCTCSSFEHSEYNVPNRECSVPNSEYNVPNSDSSVPNSEYNIPNSEYNVPNSETCPCLRGEVPCLCPMGLVRSCRVERRCLSDQVEVPKPKWAHTGCCKERRQKELTQVMCEMCATTFQTEAALRSHQLIHTGEKPYQCSECPGRFRLKILLERHIRTHTGDRPFQCQLCPKAFKSQAGKSRHQLVHTKERRHRCEVCAKTFQTSSCVKAHVRSVHMKVPQPPRARNRRRK